MPAREILRPSRRRLPGGVWALGLVSLFMDLSSEMIFGLLPVFLVGVLGVTAAGLGVIEGIAESTASLTRLFSGAWSDRWGRRKPLAVLGYGLAALSKPAFPLATGALTVFGARFVDRIGKGIRGAPRDALVADLTEPRDRGAAYGLRQSLDTAGALAGPLLAIGLMVGLHDNFRTVFWIATVPAFIAVGILIAAVREPARPRPAVAPTHPLAWRSWKRFPRSFWRLTVVVGLLTLSRFSEAFLVLRTQSVGLSPALAPLTLVVMNLSYVLSAYPAGVLSDRMPRHRLLITGCLVMVAADLLLGFGGGILWIFAGIAIWGLHLGLTEGLISALTADQAPAELRGTAFGLINLVRGVLLLVASLGAGGLWTYLGPSAAFMAGATFAFLAALLAMTKR